MIRYASEVTIARAPGEVFPYLVERERQALWSDVPMTPLTEGPLRAGSRMRLTFGKGPLSASLTLEMTAIDVNERTAFTTVSQGGIQWDGEYRLVPSAEGTGTRLSQQGTLRFMGLWRLAEPIVGAEIRRGEIAELERLKAVLERAPEA
jgi:Polyketide cyclase / dehydrase and lipid transport